MSFRPIYEGWDIPGRLSRHLRKTFAGIGLNRDLQGAMRLAEALNRKVAAHKLDTGSGHYDFAASVAERAVQRLGADSGAERFRFHLACIVSNLMMYEGWFDVPDISGSTDLARSDLWQLEDELKRIDAIVEHLDDTKELVAGLLAALVSPLVEQHPQLLTDSDDREGDMTFAVSLADMLQNAPKIVEHTMQVPFDPDLEPLILTPHLQERLEYNLHIASGGVPGDPRSVRTPKLPTAQSNLPTEKLIETYLGGTPLTGLFNYFPSIPLPQATRFEHHHIVAGSGHGKTQTLQQLILHDLDAVADGQASIIVIDSQSDLINTIAGLSVFAPGGKLADRLCLIDPTDVEWPVALNLFDVGMERINQYSQLDRERLINGILELYDFVLGSLLDAGMTQKQSIIFRYLTRLLLHIPDATIHTFRELLEDDGYEKYRQYIDGLSGSARAFFETEYNSREFVQTRKQVLRRLYGILENQSFERMFSHPQSKLDLFSEMNAGKVILINTAKDLLKENGTEIFGRFFIAMIAQAAQERAVLSKAERLPTFVYVDEANDYFDRNIGIILNQARKYNIGMVLAHQFLGQMDARLQEAISANTAIKFAGGVSARDARALAGDLRTDASFIESQSKLSFAAFIKGSTSRAVSISIEPGKMEQEPRMTAEEKEAQREAMRAAYAVHYSEINGDAAAADKGEPETGEELPPEDDGKPMRWD